MIKNLHYLTERIRTKKSFLCVGLDPDYNKIPDAIKDTDDPLLIYCADVLEQTIDHAVAVKINVAFFEKFGSDGFRQLEDLVALIPEDCFIIADAKRADIGNTSAQYAEYYFSKLNVDAVTLHPYMGLDSLEPFFDYKDKWSVILALTSNPGSSDFEKLELKNSQRVYESVLEKFSESKYADQLMYVVGATQTEHMQSIRNIVPDSFLLIPGVGEQGGNLKSTVEGLRNKHEGILINVSRKIMFPKGKESTKSDIKAAVMDYAEQMKIFF